MNHDGLQGWSLEEISDAMGLLANQTEIGNPDGQISGAENQNTNLVLSVEDLYAFNAGYYFVVAQQGNSRDAGQLVSNPNIPELMSISALGGMEFNTVLPTGTEFNLEVSARNVMFDRAFFETVSRPSTSTRVPGIADFRGGGTSQGGQPGSASVQGGASQAPGIPMA